MEIRATAFIRNLEATTSVEGVPPSPLPHFSSLLTTTAIRDYCYLSKSTTLGAAGSLPKGEKN
jgi:hypothetical protein